MLSHEETLELIERSQNGDNDAKTTLIENNSPLIKSIIRRYRNKGVDYQDLYQLGSMGFIKAIKNFDTKYNVRFSTYAVPMIAGEVKRFLRDDGYIKVSRALKMVSSKINQFIDKYKQENSDDPTIDIIAKEFNMDAAEVVFTMDSAKMPISLFEKTDDSNDKSQGLIDKIIVNDKSEDIIDNIIIKDLINELPEREKQIIILRFYRDKTQGEIARVLGVSQVQVSRLEAKIIAKLKGHFAESTCKEG